jgi:AraC-like DNA-binding protein
MSARSKRLSPVQSTHRRSSMNDNVHVSRFGVSILPLGYAYPGTWGTPSALADFVESMTDCDVACPDQARMLTFKCIPGTALRLVIQYRTPIIWTRQFGSHVFAVPDYRHYLTRHDTGVLVVQPGGPLGTLSVRLRPEAAASLLGESLQCDATIELDDLFGAGQVSLIVEMLSEARTSAERFACVERFLAANLRTRRVEPVACRAAALLRRNPQLRISHLAAALDVSERHLSRRFRATFGTTPKQFAQIARIESVFSARAQGATWADIAHAAGFTDQAHMINDFTEIVGVPPAQLVRLPCS